MANLTMQQNMFCCSVNCHKTWQNMALPCHTPCNTPYHASCGWPLDVGALYKFLDDGLCRYLELSIFLWLALANVVNMMPLWNMQCVLADARKSAIMFWEQKQQWFHPDGVDKQFCFFFPMIQCRQNFEICYSLFSQALGHLVTFKNAFDTRAKSKEGTSGRFVSISHITSKRYFLPTQTVTSERLDHVAVGACPFIVRVWNWFIWSVDPCRSGRNCERQLSWYHTMQGLLPSFKTDVSEQTLCDLALSWASQRMGPNWTFIYHFSVPENMVYTHLYPHSWPILSERWSRMMINHRNLGVS